MRKTTVKILCCQKQKIIRVIGRSLAANCELACHCERPAEAKQSRRLSLLSNIQKVINSGFRDCYVSCLCFFLAMTRNLTFIEYLIKFRLFFWFNHRIIDNGCIRFIFVINIINFRIVSFLIIDRFLM